jgi:hypothetical protein
VGFFSEVPVLAEEAIEGAGFVEDGEVCVSVFGPLAVRPLWVAGTAAAGTDPIGDAVCGEWIVIPGDSGAAGSAADQLSFAIGPDAAVPDFVLAYSAFILADVAHDSHGGIGRLHGESEVASLTLMDQVDFPHGVFVGSADAAVTERQDVGDFTFGLTAYPTLSHASSAKEHEVYRVLMLYFRFDVLAGAVGSFASLLLCSGLGDYADERLGPRCPNVDPSVVQVDADTIRGVD